MASPPIPIAVIGMACRLPGGSTSPDRLWEMLSEGRSGWVETPADRWNRESFHNAYPEAKESLPSKSGYFLQQDISEFDARFFGIPPYEASAVDPQQRILLETTYEALENAGHTLESIKGTDTAVFVATFARDYDRMGWKDLQEINRSQVTGTGDAITSNRLSYFFDINGPSLTLDTGCSGSLVALHLAFGGLQSGDSRMAIVAGTQLLIHPDQTVAMGSVGMVNPDGRCYVFDSRGDGYARGEGVSTIVLKRLDNALADGDHIHAVIANTGSNQDGKTGGMSVPSGIAQAALMRKVYSRAGLDPAETLYVEAHGTGTKIGDKEEVGSINEVFCEGIKRETELYIGSIKSNIGHLEACSGIAGLLKTILILKNETIPPNLDFKEAKPTLKLGQRTLKIALERRPLFPTGYTGPRRVSVNSFGYGGTNAHAIVESVETAVARFSSLKAPNKALSNGVSNGVSSGVTNGHNGVADGTNGYRNGTNDITLETNGNTDESNGFHIDTEIVPTPLPFPISAFTEKSLLDISTQIQEWLTSHKTDTDTLRNLSYTLSAHRTQLAWRNTVVASTAEELIAELKQVGSNKNKAVSTVPIAFIFTGQGAQWNAMGRELITHSKVFRRSILTSARLLTEFGSSWDLIEELSKDDKTTLLGQAELAQPATTAIQVALVDLFASLSITPSRVVGHSSGEIAAAYAAGAVSHGAAIELAYRRGISSGLSKKYNSTKGSMLAVGLGEEEILPFVKETKKGIITVACVNSPNSTTISGDEAAIDELGETLQGKGIFNRKLKVDTAYHSHHMKTISQSYLDSCSHIQTGTSKSNVTFYSSVVGDRKSEGFGPEYWTQNLTSKVRFNEALKLLRADVIESKSSVDPSVFLEIGPSNALAGPVRQILAHDLATPLKYTYLSALWRGKDATYTSISAAAKLVDLGVEVDLKALTIDEKPQRLLDLPAYPWDKNKYWHESRLSKDHRFREFPYHDLLGLKDVHSNLLEPRWRYHVNQDALPWVKDHVVDNFTIFPGSGYVCMVIEGMKQLFQMRKSPGVISKFIFRNISFSKSIIVPEDKQDGSDPEVELQLTISPAKNYDSSRWERFRIFSYNKEGVWNEHCSGHVAVDVISKADEVEGTREEDAALQKDLDMLEAIRANCTEAYDAEKFYEDMRETGNNYGPQFAILGTIYSGPSQGYMEMTIPDIQSNMPHKVMKPHTMHPIVLDAIHQLGAILFKKFVSNAPVVPTNTSEVWISADITTKPGDTLYVALDQISESDRSSLGNTYVYQKDAEGKFKPVLRVSDGQMRAIGDAVADDTNVPFSEQVGFRMAWDTDAQFLTDERFFDRVERTDLRSLLASDGKLPEEAEGLTYNEIAVRTITVGEQSASIYLRDALHRIDQENIQPATPHFVKLLAWIRKWVASPESDKFIEQVGGSEYEAAFLARTENAGVEGKMLGRVCRALPEIIAGKADALALMLEDNLLNAFYSNRLVLTNYAQMAEYLRLLAFKKPSMKFLEIGAGTGAATVPLLKALTREDGVQFDRYAYTDISSGFFEQARGVFAQWEDYIDYKVLDIEQDPLSQGYAAESYDVIICSNVLHATKVMERTMQNVRKLLKPGGKLVLIEVTRLTASNNTIFGCLPGWWAFEDQREDSPLLSTDQWNSLCLATGFSGLELNCPDHTGPTKRTTLMVAQAVESEESSITHAPRVKLLRGADTAAVNGLVEVLEPALKAINGMSYTEEVWRDLKDEIDLNAIYIVIDTTEAPVLHNPNQERFDSIQSLLVNSQNLLWISLQEGNSPHTEAMKGLIRGASRVMRRENGLLKFITLDVQVPWETINAENLIHSLLQISQACFWPANEVERSHEYEFGFADEHTLIPRVQKDNKFYSWVERVTKKNDKIEKTPYHQPDRPLRLEVGTPGLLGSLHFVDDESFQTPMLEREIEVKVQTYGINFKDVFIALGQMVPGVNMVGEACGIVTKVGKEMQHRYKIGDRVTGVGAKPFASHARLNGNLSYPMPPSISFEVGATIPTVYLTAWYSLVHVARLEPGQSILIHAASGGVGQAAIQLAQHIGATIYATVGRPSKAQLLTDTYGIAPENIFSTRARNFKGGVLRATGGVGVDVVLNSLSGEMLNDSWEIVAPLGTFVEIGKSDIYKRSNLIMAPFDRAITFAAVDLVRLFEKHSAMLHRYYGEIFKLFEQKAFYALSPVNTLPMEKIEEAFRLIAGRKHTGKVVLQCGDDAVVQATIAKPKKLELIKNGTYVIAGGLGDLGKRIAKWLSTHGAGHIVTLSRRTLEPDVRAEFEAEITANGSRLHLIQSDILSEDSVAAAAEYCSNLPPVRGIIHGGMVLRDHPMTHMTQEHFNEALGPKVTGTINLDKYFASDELDFFVMMSSLTCIMGNPSQSNYAAGNAFQDAFAHAMKSRSSHTKYISLNLGAIQGSDSIRLVAIREKELIRNSAVLMSFEEMWLVLEYAMGIQGREDGLVQEILGFSRESMIQVDDRMALENPLFSQLPLRRDKKGAGGDDNKIDAPAAVKAAKTLAEAEGIITQAIVAKFAIFMDKPVDEVAIDEPLLNIGLDSLVSIELKNWMVRTFQVVLQTSEIAGAASIIALGKTLAARSKLVKEELKTDQNASQQEDQTIAITPQESTNTSDEATHGHQCCRTSKELPRFPLVDLDDALEDLYTNISPHAANDEERANLRAAVDEFLAKDGIPRALHKELRQRADDPNCESWIADLLLRALFLERRFPLAPHGSFIGTQKDSAIPHTQAERAAIIAITAIKFKEELESGRMEPDVYGQTPLCMYSWHWMFNAVREANVGCDKMQKHAGDYIVVLRQGHVFKVPFPEGEEIVRHEKLEATFQAIANLELKENWSGILTTDERNSWAENRQTLLELDPTNVEYIRTIEAAAFVLCLDDNEPVTRLERIKFGYIGDGFNRWFDKSLAWIIPNNGRSAHLIEHTSIDGLSTHRLNSWIQEAIYAHTPRSQIASNGSNGHNLSLDFEEFTLKTTSEIDNRILGLRQNYLNLTKPKTYSYLTVPKLGKDLLLENTVPIKGSIDLTIQLASRLFHGYTPASWEVVTVSQFHRGRTEILQVVHDPILKFIDAALDPKVSNAERRKLLITAANDSNAYLKHGSEGKNYFRLMDVLELMGPRKGQENRPKLWEDPVWKRVEPGRHIMSTLDDGGVDDACYNMFGRGSIWINYTVWEDRFTMSCVNDVEDKDKWEQALLDAGEIVRAIVTGK